ncbi:MAG: membrane integrity-associated transporter subunit PqiC [Desulfomonile tiedjei]|nr:membrane integrity-associated transporter subunit PqiC [Desulfomonile tiedjei]
MNSLHVAMIFGLVVLAGGCSLKSREAIIYHAFEYPPPSKESGVTIPETLMVYRFLLDPAVDIYSLVLANSKGAEESMSLHRWKDNPADMITELVLRDIESSGLFEKVVDQTSNARYRYALEGTVRRLQGAARDGKVFATLEAEATLTDFDPPRAGQKALMTQSYKMETTSGDATAGAVVRALNLAVQEFSSRLRADIKTAMEMEAPKIKQRMRRKADLWMPGADSQFQGTWKPRSADLLLQARTEK